MTPMGYFTTDHAVNMTLRDYFAAQAMQSQIGDLDLRYRESRQVIAERAYLMADAMMKARDA